MFNNDWAWLDKKHDQWLQSDKAFEEFHGGRDLTEEEEDALLLQQDREMCRAKEEYYKNKYGD